MFLQKMLMFRIVAIAVTVSGVVAGAAARADEAEDRAVAFLESIDGKIVRDDNAPGKPVISVDLGFRPVTDVGLKELAALKNLTALYLWNTQVTDADLKELAPLTNLTKLYLNNTKVTDAGLKELQMALPKCKISR